jgi:tetratricopeptide (TPR) repeat protein
VRSGQLANQMRPVQHQSVVTLPSQTIFVGRELERSHLYRLLDQAQGRHGCLVTIGGEPGVGKTRLGEEIAGEATRHRFTILRGRCYETDGAAPYIPFVEAIEAALDKMSAREFRKTLGADASEVARIMPRLRHLYADIPPPLELPAAQQQRYLFKCFGDFLARIAGKHPLILFIDDLHWAGATTLLLVEHIAARLPEMPVLMLATYRDGEVETSDQLARSLERLLRLRAVDSVVLKPLPKAGVEAMLRALSTQEPPSNLVDLIYDQTEGNPFFVESVFGHLNEEGKLFDDQHRFRKDLAIGELEAPVSVRLTIGRRLKRLDLRTREVVGIAAIIGRSFSFKVLEALAGIETRALLEVIDRLLRAQVIIPSSDEANTTFIFAHELIRQTVLASLSLPRRQRLHLQVAHEMEKLSSNAPEQYDDQIAEHLYKAGSLADGPKAISHLTRAGERALDASAFEDALRHFERALALKPASNSLRADLRYKLGLAQRSVGRWDDALRSWDEALVAFEAIGDFEAAGRICAVLNGQLSWAGRWADSIKMGARGLALLGERVSRDRCRMLAANGSTLSLAGHHDAGSKMINQALAMAEELNDPHLKGAALFGKVIHHFTYMHHREAVDACIEGIAHLRDGREAWLNTDLQIFLVASYLSLGRFDDLAKASTELKSGAERLGNVPAQISCERDRKSSELITSGNINGWREFVLSDLEICERIRNRSLSAASLSFLGVVELWRGNWDQALTHLKEGAAREPSGPLGGNWVLVALASAYAGRREEALALLERRHDEFPTAHRANNLAAWMIMLTAVEVFFVAGERPAAANLYSLVTEAIKSGVTFRPFDFRLLESVAGIAATAAKDWGSAEQHFRRALRISAELPHRLEQPEVRRFYAQMLLERDSSGDREKARKLLDEAIDQYEQIGMPKHREMAEALLRSATTIVTGPAAAVAVPTASIFRRDGHYWTIAYEGKVVRLKDAKGLRDIACLLASPGRSLHVADLMAATAGELRDPRSESYAAMSRQALSEMGLKTSGAGSEPLIDAQARKEYRARLAELHEELEEAERMCDPVRTDFARQELDAIAGQLTAAYGLGHRRREPTDPAERARIAVAMRIRSALERIEKEHLPLGRHLSRAIQTGTFCSYSPEVPTMWEL